MFENPGSLGKSIKPGTDRTGITVKSDVIRAQSVQYNEDEVWVISARWVNSAGRGL
ncbi:MAG: hypothetical protein ACYTBV_06570 [Planctomycetota bacterium]